MEKDLKFTCGRLPCCLQECGDIYSNPLFPSEVKLPSVMQATVTASQAMGSFKTVLII